MWHKDPWELRLVQEDDIQDRRYFQGIATKRTSTGGEEDDSEEDSEQEDGTVSVAKRERPTNGRKLQGRMRIGDAVDDEWLVVWLLRQVSSKWPELIIS